MSATSDLKMADYDIPVYPGTMLYNPQAKDHGIIIGCLIFHGLLMYIQQSFASLRGLLADRDPVSVKNGRATQETTPLWPRIFT